MLEEERRVNGPKLKIIFTIIIFSHSSDINSMLSHNKPMITFIISQKGGKEKRQRLRDREERSRERGRLRKRD